MIIYYDFRTSNRASWGCSQQPCWLLWPLLTLSGGVAEMAVFCRTIQGMVVWRGQVVGRSCEPQLFLAIYPLVEFRLS